MWLHASPGSVWKSEVLEKAGNVMEEAMSRSCSLLGRAFPPEKSLASK